MSTIAKIHQEFNSLISLQPLVNVLKKMIAEGKPGARKLYEGLLNEVQAIPQLLEPSDDVDIFLKHRELVDSLLSAIFPPSTSANDGLYAISFPFRHETFYASEDFKNFFLTDDTNVITLPDRETTANINKALVKLACNVILRQFYSFEVPAIATSIHLFSDPDTGMDKYLELELNAQFVEVKCINNDFALPVNFSPQRALDTEELLATFPLENFQFEGLVVINVADVTQSQVIAEIKNTLLTINTSSDLNVYDKIQQHLETLMELKDIRTGLTPFYKMNEVYLYSEAHYQNSFLYRNKNVAANRKKIIDICHKLFKDTDNPLLYQTLNETNSKQNELLQYYFAAGAKSLIICPLKCDDGELIGLLEIISNEGGTLKFQHVLRLQPAMKLFSLALEKSIENLELQIDKTIKEHFTAIQNAVEWKFTEAAFNYIKTKQLFDAAKMPPITFEDVYPLYGAIDVRNSSVERNNSIQLDLIEQLTLAREVLEKATKQIQFPLLKEIQFKIDQYISSTSEALLSDDEMLIYDFLQQDLDALFKHLKLSNPELEYSINSYFNALDPQRNIVYHHRKEYEESITKINDVLDRFIDNEQKFAQQVYPHYFERYITDGIEFNIYIGQSLAPNNEFDEIYVKNLKLWQITMLAKAARLTNALEKKLSLPLQTTQLILAHSIPLTISFRRKERKFDVDGAYNIRYEIVKKRIDKVNIKNTEERLTQPGKIAVVYSQQKELNEYLEYITYLQNEGLLDENIEHLELEDTQGISGLKAIRVDVNLVAPESNGNGNGTAKNEMAKVPTKQLLRK